MTQKKGSFEMTPEQIAAMQADALAGTPGDWALVQSIPQEGWNGWYLKGRPSTVLHGFTYEICNIIGPQDSTTQTANARRIARVPCMEATIIAQAAEIEKLCGVLEHGLKECARETVRAECADAEIERLTAALGNALGWLTCHAVTKAEAEICAALEGTPK